MAAGGIPSDYVYELRGVQPASQFVNRDTGQLVDVPAKAKLEYQLPDGDVAMLELSGKAFERATGSFDFNTAERGDLVRLVGRVRDGDNGSYLQVVRADVATAQELIEVGES